MAVVKAVVSTSPLQWKKQMDAPEWITVDFDGRGFRCERCGETENLSMPRGISRLNSFMLRGQAFGIDHCGCEEVPTGTSTAPIVVSGSKTNGPLKNRPKASDTVDHVDHHWEPPDNPFSFLDAPGCPETNTDGESGLPPVMAALDAYKQGGGFTNGKIRGDADRMAAEYGETCVVEAILWAMGKKAPIQQAWARVRRQTWEAADASIPAKPDNSQYEKNKRIAAECAARDAERIARGETL